MKKHRNFFFVALCLFSLSCCGETEIEASEASYNLIVAEEKANDSLFVQGYDADTKGIVKVPEDIKKERGILAYKRGYYRAMYFVKKGQIAKRAQRSDFSPRQVPKNPYFYRYRLFTTRPGTAEERIYGFDEYKRGFAAGLKKFREKEKAVKRTRETKGLE